jgi:hypothetical protein
MRVFLPLLLFAPLVAAQPNPVQESSISGAVTDQISGEPLAKAQVLAKPSNGRPASTTTDSKGNFTLVHLPPGEYRLSGARNGYLETYYGARRPGSKGTTITLTPGLESKDLQLKLLPFAVVAGIVRDPEGEPLAGAHVALIAVSYRNGIRRAQATGQYASTDDLGQYRIPSVAPGRYYVRAGPPELNDGVDSLDHSPTDARPPEVLVPTFHPGARDVEGARRIEIAAGDRFSGADVTLLRSRLYRVRVSFEAPPGLSSGVWLNSRPDLSDGLLLRPVGDCKPGTCEFARVPAGSYLASGSAGPAKMTVDDMFSNSAETYASASVDVTSADVDGVRLVISAGAEIAGRITVADGDAAEAKQVHIGFVDSDGSDHGARFSEDGLFTALLSPGHYEVQVFADGDLVAKSIRSEDTDVMQEGLTVSDTGKLPLEITLSHDAATVEGIVQDSDDHPVPGATVVLVPETKRRSRHSLYERTSTDQSGRYRFGSVTPGDYKLFVWADVEDGIWFDPEFMKDVESDGHSITVAAKDRQAINLRLPPGGK